MSGFSRFNPHTAANINALWCGMLVEELGRLGVRDVVVSPGSRNTPLVAALVSAGTMRVTAAIDERGAGFHALGCAQAGRAAAVVTTSGTAVMNLLPAVTEARQSGVPLLVLSADRPVEARDCGSNQTIDALGPLAALVKWQHDLPAPDDRLPARLALTALDESVRVATGGFPGPVQLNCAFRKPLEPTAVEWDAACLAGLEAWFAGSEPFVRNVPVASRPDLREVLAEISRTERGLLVVGNTREGDRIRPLAESLGWPVIADPGSGLRTRAGELPLIRYAQWMNDLPQPDLLLQLGSRLVSGKLEQWLESLPARRILIDPAEERRNPGHVELTRVTAGTGESAEALAEACLARMPGPWTQAWLDADSRIGAVIDNTIASANELTEAEIARDVAAADQRLFLGNSLPVRHVGGFAAGSSSHGGIGKNRGASGIDGVLATACGLACGTGEPIVLLIGDLSLLHDLNSLLLARRSRQKVLIVAIHNGGGGIFDHLPVAQYPEVKAPLCDGTHDVALAPLAAGFGLPTWVCRTRDEWQSAWIEAQACGESCLIEAVVPRDGHGRWVARLRGRLADG